MTIDEHVQDTPEQEDLPDEFYNPDDEEEQQSEEVDDEQEEPEKDEDLSKLKAEIARLNQLVRDMKEAQSSINAQVDDSPFLTPDEFNNLTYEEFNKVLHNVYIRAITTARELLSKELPQVIEKRITHNQSAEKRAQEFYNVNKDLAKHKGYCAYVARVLAAQHPEWSEAKLLNEVARTARKELGLTSSSGRMLGPQNVRRPARGRPNEAEQDLLDLLGG